MAALRVVLLLRAGRLFGRVAPAAPMRHLSSLRCAAAPHMSWAAARTVVALPPASPERPPRGA
eukprot:10007870-Alexandrium_andersonii.AAC.1